MMTKRLEAGTFSWPRSVEPGAGKLRLAPEAFAMPFGYELRAEWLTDGIDLRGAKPFGGLRALSLSKRLRPWYERGE